MLKICPQRIDRAAMVSGDNAPMGLMLVFGNSHWLLTNWWKPGLIVHNHCVTTYLGSSKKSNNLPFHPLIHHQSPTVWFVAINGFVWKYTPEKINHQSPIHISIHFPYENIPNHHFHPFSHGKSRCFGTVNPLSQGSSGPAEGAGCKSSRSSTRSSWSVANCWDNIYNVYNIYIQFLIDMENKKKKEIENSTAIQSWKEDNL